VPGGSDAPKIAKVTDLGDVPALPAHGELPVRDSDGKFAIGELVLIEGSGFGKLPSVKTGGAPLDIAARTATAASSGASPPASTPARPGGDAARARRDHHRGGALRPPGRPHLRHRAVMALGSAAVW
jgi:hypothetical protein